LGRLLRAKPALATHHLDTDDSYAGPYFARPALLWIVAENPIRNHTLPANICAIAGLIVQAGATASDIDYTLQVVASGCVAREMGLQKELIEALVGWGGNPSLALGTSVRERETEAARLLLRLGGEPGPGAAAGLGETQTLERLLQGPVTPREIEDALYSAAVNDQWRSIALMLQRGVDVNTRIGPQRCTVLHQAAIYNFAELARHLVAHGADKEVRDQMFDSTPAGWAAHAGHRKMAWWLEKGGQGARP
jgi:peptide-methionine (S)-S-oxide reductase